MIPSGDEFKVAVKNDPLQDESALKMAIHHSYGMSQEGQHPATWRKTIFCGGHLRGHGPVRTMSDGVPSRKAVECEIMNICIDRIKMN